VDYSDVFKKLDFDLKLITITKLWTEPLSKITES